MFRQRRRAATTDFGRGLLLNVEGDYDSMIEKQQGRGGGGGGGSATQMRSDAPNDGQKGETRR